MKILVTTQPIRMHLMAMVGLFRALEAAGHEVAVASAPSFRPFVSRLGLPVFAAGLDWLDTTAPTVFPDLVALSDNDKRAWFLTGLFAGLAPQNMVADVLSVVRAWKPDLLLRNDFEFSAPLVAERDGLPLATIGVDLGLPAAKLRHAVGRPLSFLRRRLGLPADAEDAAGYGSVYLSLLPPSVQAPEFLRDAPVHTVRATPWDEPAERAAGERPRVWVSQDGEEAERVAELQEAGHEAALLPDAPVTPGDLLVTDGRFADVARALAEGLTMIISPRHSPPPIHLPRWEALGVARLVRSGPLSPDEWRVHTRAVLDDARYRVRSARLRQESLRLPPLADAVMRLEQAAGIGRSAAEPTATRATC
jgi:UDP:flavonoid glycosyltransferase YjiC (YdhE family)